MESYTKPILLTFAFILTTPGILLTIHGQLTKDKAGGVNATIIVGPILLALGVGLLVTAGGMFVWGLYKRRQQDEIGIFSVDGRLDNLPPDFAPPSIDDMAQLGDPASVYDVDLEASGVPVHMEGQTTGGQGGSWDNSTYCNHEQEYQRY